MRKFLTILCVLLFTVPLVAQQRTGNITGEITDSEGNPLPGVTVTLSQVKMAPQTSITSARGVFRFISLFPANDYEIKCELEGFKTRRETGIIVTVGGATELKLTMELGALEEEITVVAVSPVIDTKKTSVTQTVNYETMQSLPSARDPWVILQMTPSVQVDRENIGGNESGQQSTYVAKGGNRYNSVWTMDGVVITDPAARGASPTYYDFDMFEEMNVTVGGADVETQTGGVALNLVSRRGGNRVSIGGRFYLTDEKFQAAPSGDQYEDLKKIFGEDAGYNRLRDIKDFGFNAGGPLWKDKAWWWGSYGVQEIKTNIITGAKDDTFLTNIAGKINLQILPENRFEAFIHAGKKEKFGRSSSTSLPQGLNQLGKYHFGSPIIKLQDEHMFGENLFISAKYGFTDAGFGLWPAEDPELKEMSWYNYKTLVYEKTYTWFFSGRPNAQYTLHSTYFNDDLLGASHEFKMGVEYVDRRCEYVSGFPGNMRVWYNYTSKTVDFNGDGKRDIVLDDFGVDIRQLRFYRGTTFGGIKTAAYIGFIQDTITVGRLTLKLGLRYDKQRPSYLGFTGDTIYTTASEDSNLKNYLAIQQKYLGSGVADAVLSIFPGVQIPATSDTNDWNFLSPRIGMTWDVTGDGKTIAKLNASAYGGYMGVWGWYWAQQGAGGNIQFWWWDKNKDRKADLNELYWATYDSARTIYPAFDSSGNFLGNWNREYNYMWWGYNRVDPSQLDPSRYTFGNDWAPDRTYEVLFTLEREVLPDLGVALDFTYRKYDQFWRTQRYAYEAGGELLTKDHYTAVGTIPSSFVGADGSTVSTEKAGGKTWYAWKQGVKNVYERYVTVWPNDRYNDYIGIDLRFNKRLSDKWMMDGSFTWQMQKAHYGTNGYDDPSELWAIDGKPFAYSLGGASGKLSQPIYSRWMFKLQGLYQLPYDVNVSFSFNTREGHIVPKVMTIYDENWVNPYNQSLETYIEEFGSTRLPTFWNLNLRLEKVLRVGDLGKIFIMADIFNLFNNNILNRQRQIDLGTYYVTDEAHSPNPRSGEPNEVVNPRVLRLGVRFQF